ncbi:hypothetical protein [Muricoccus radiodurans]|uniref:hypothetical protein n=1 Tax=Muricoccus radiodurans TaxID=2231721 RepID=UPI003CF8EE76
MPKPLFGNGTTPVPTPAPAPAPAPAPVPVRVQAPAAPARAPAPAFPGIAVARPPVLDLVTDPEGTASAKVMAEARTLAVALAERLGEARFVAEFGSAVQARIGALPDRMLDLVRSEVPNDVTARMGRIRGQITGLSVDDLFAADGGVASRVLRSLAPAQDRLGDAIRAVELECAGIDAALPKLRAGLDEIEAMIAEEAAAREELEAHIRALQAVLALHARPEAADPRLASALRALEDRGTGLRQSRIVATTDAAQLEVLRLRYAELHAGARSLTVDLVGLWKRNCVQSIAILAQGTRAAPREVRTAATGLRGAADGITAAIDALSPGPNGRMGGRNAP